MLSRLREGSLNIVQLLRIATDRFIYNECPLRAASLAYYALFSMFPLGLFLIYLGGGFLSEENVLQTLEAFLNQFFPVSSDKLITVINHALVLRGSIGLIGLIGLFWSASSVFGVLEWSLSKIWAGTPSPFWRRRLLGAVSVLALSGFFIGSFYLRPMLDWIWSPNEVFSRDLLNFAIGLGISTIVSLLLFRIFPNREIPWRPALIGALVAGLAIELIRGVFGYYLAVVGRNFGFFYGSIAWIFALGIWVYLVGLVFFLGAEIGAAIDRDN
ncbi:MAG: YihY/virulence factor BrkB family protein [Anaerolineae bacterium]|nr:YihY/virulence factor BrkB family protein [Anaerolineae bacterium]